MGLARRKGSGAKGVGVVERPISVVTVVEWMTVGGRVFFLKKIDLDRSI